MKKIIILFLSLSIIFLVACQDVDLSKVSDEDLGRLAEKAIVCEEPYMRFGTSCCLDQDANKICDEDETVNVADGVEEETTTPEPEEILCEDECEENFCEDKEWIECNIGSDGCKHPTNKGFVKGRCFVGCIKQSDCMIRELCEDNVCVTRFSQVDTTEFRAQADGELSNIEQIFTKRENGKTVFNAVIVASNEHEEFLARVIAGSFQEDYTGEVYMDYEIDDIAGFNTFLVGIPCEHQVINKLMRIEDGCNPSDFTEPGRGLIKLMDMDGGYALIVLAPDDKILEGTTQLLVDRESYDLAGIEMEVVVGS
ncbi:MAG: hypothetical protein KKG59_00305 [Nanoarchaeota archaeon]|nr:hypothetical protein [Nanoarchaeota archaeon]